MTIKVQIPLVGGGFQNIPVSKIKDILPVGDFFSAGTCLVELKGDTFITALGEAQILKDNLTRQIAQQKAKTILNKKKKEEKVKWTIQTQYQPQMQVS